MRHFDISEFDSPGETGSALVHMDATFLSMIDEARAIAGVPFKINSGYRTAERNMAVGGSDNSSHLRGLAADIHCVDDKSRK